MGAETPRLIFLQRKLSDTLNLKDKLMTVIKFWHFKMFSGSFVHNALKITKLLKTNKTTPPPPCFWSKETAKRLKETLVHYKKKVKFNYILPWYSAR